MDSSLPSFEIKLHAFQAGPHYVGEADLEFLIFLLGPQAWATTLGLCSAGDRT